MGDESGERRQDDRDLTTSIASYPKSDEPSFVFAFSAPWSTTVFAVSELDIKGGGASTRVITPYNTSLFVLYVLQHNAQRMNNSPLQSPVYRIVFIVVYNCNRVV